MPPSQARSQSAPLNIQWRRGEFRTFYAQMKIRVGGHNGNSPVELLKGDEFEYDGSICKYAGAEFPQPNLRAAIRDGWATTNEEISDPAPFVASRDVAVSQSKNTDLSRVQRRPRQPLENDSLDEETVLDVNDRRAAMNPRTGQGHLGRSDNRRTAADRGVQPPPEERMAVSASELDEQDGVEISRIRTPKSLKVDILAKPNAARDIELSMDHDKGVGRYAGERRTRSNVIEREGVTITTNNNMDRSVRPETSDGTEGRHVGNVRHSTASKRNVEGMTIEDTSGDRTRPRAPRPAPAKAAAPPAKAAPKVRIPDDASPKLKVAIRLCPDFPVDWNFFAKPEDKLAKIKKLGTSPSLLDALYAVESSAMKKTLEQKYKSHFG
jgi:hypothetical protein